MMQLKRLCALMMAVLVLVASLGCQSTKPLPQPRRVVDPGQVDGSIITARWDIGAVQYEHLGQGLDYSKAGLAPVFLVFRNKSLQTPVVRVEEIRGVGVDGEYLPYSIEESVKLVFAEESFTTTASNASRTGALGAFLGAGLGALLGTIGGGDNIWKGAAIGAGAGGLLGGAAGTYSSSEADLKRTIRGELAQYGWNDEPVPADYTKVGYVYLPADRDISQIKVVVRDEGTLESYTIDIADIAPLGDD